MGCLDDYPAPIWLQLLHENVSDHACQPFLHLRSPGIALDEPSQLTESDHPPSWHIPNMDVAREGEQVVFTDRRKRDIAEDNQLSMLLVEGHAEVTPRFFVQASEELCIRCRNALGRAQQAFPLGILANRQQYFAHRSLDTNRING
jgi:hypothetical protein